MRWSGVGFVLLVAGCEIEPAVIECGDVICPLGSSCLQPGMCSTALLPDADDDSIADIADNCPSHENAGQDDRDGDTVGDACDNCILVSNVEQSDNRDGDPLGDACDPNPFSAGDCLLLVDTFSDPAAFAANWTVSPTNGSVSVAPGAITLTTPVDDVRVGIALNGFTSGSYDLQGLAQLDVGMGGSFRLVSNSGGALAGYSCEVTGESVYARRQLASGDEVSANGVVVPGPDGTDVLLQLAVEQTAENAHVRCRADIGLALGLASLSNSNTDLNGPPAVHVRKAATVHVVAVSKWMPGTTCPPTVYR